MAADFRNRFDRIVRYILNIGQLNIEFLICFLHVKLLKNKKGACKMNKIKVTNQSGAASQENKQMYFQALQEAIDIVEKNLDAFSDTFPHVSKNNHYEPEKNALWTASFYPGMCCLAYELTEDPKFLKNQDKVLDSFEERLQKRIHITHDLGFLYTLSCVSLYKLTGNQRAEQIAKKAVTMLAERYHEKGKYIQAWGEMGIGYPDVKIIIDCMLNLPLLYWSGNEKYIKMAENHADTAAKYLIRPDYTSYHTYLMNPETGEGVCGKTHQGYEDESTWARGQAWAVYGFALSYRYTKKEKFLQIAKETAEIFIRNLPSDFVPYWDFTFSDEKPDIRDTSAGAIFVCGILELCNYVSKEESKNYLSIAEDIIQNLYKSYTTKNIADSNGILREGMYHRDDGAGECVIWGDYFYMEALVRLVSDWNPYW